MNPQLEAAFHNITDTFTGADGGMSFVQFRFLLENFSKQADEGDDASKEILLTVLRFSKLIDIASKS